MDQALEHERYSDEPVRGTNELHHLDFAPPGEHRRADRRPDQDQRSDQQQDRQPDGHRLHKVAEFGDLLDLIAREDDLVHLRDLCPEAVGKLYEQVELAGTRHHFELGRDVGRREQRVCTRVGREQPFRFSQRLGLVEVVEFGRVDDRRVLLEGGLDRRHIDITCVRIDVHDHLHAAGPLRQQVVEAALDHERAADEEQRDGRRQDRGHRQRDVAAQTRPGFAEGVCQS